MSGINEKADVIHEVLKDDGTYPNNNNLPLLLYKNVLNLTKGHPDDVIDMNPGHPLTTGPHRSTHAQFEGQHHLGQCSTSR